MLPGIANLMLMPLPAWFAACIVLAWRAGEHPGEDSNFRPAD